MKLLYILLFGVLSGLALGAMNWPQAHEDRFTAGYMRAAADIKIFVSGTRQLPNEEWAKRAAAYRLGKENDGVALGLMPDPKTTLQPLDIR